MRLQKQLSKKVGSKEYPKWVVVIPPETIDEIGWEEGDELELDKRDDRLVLKRKKSSQ